MLGWIIFIASVANSGGGVMLITPDACPVHADLLSGEFLDADDGQTRLMREEANEILPLTVVEDEFRGDHRVIIFGEIVRLGVNPADLDPNLNESLCGE